MTNRTVYLRIASLLCNPQLVERTKEKTCGPDDLSDLQPSSVTEQQTESGRKYLGRNCSYIEKVTDTVPGADGVLCAIICPNFDI